jgi:hypothetical protein
MSDLIDSINEIVFFSGSDAAAPNTMGYSKVLP